MQNRELAREVVVERGEQFAVAAGNRRRILPCGSDFTDVDADLRIAGLERIAVGRLHEIELRD